MSTTPKIAPPGQVRPEVMALVRSAQSGGEPDHYTGKRAAPRITETLQLEISTDPSKGKVVCASMHNVSEMGCAFWARKKMEPDEKIFLREFNPESPNPWIESYVTHCTQGVQGFLTGVRFAT